MGYAGIVALTPTRYSHDWFMVEVVGNDGAPMLATKLFIQEEGCRDEHWVERDGTDFVCSDGWPYGPASKPFTVPSPATFVTGSPA